MDDKSPPPYPPPSVLTAPSEASTSTPFRTTFASLSMHMGDRLRLLNFPPEIIAIIRQTISTSWPRGLQSEMLYHGSHEFKLRGYPWRGHGEEGILSRRLMSRILSSLQTAGWLLTVVTDVSKKLTDLDTLVFRHAPSDRPDTSAGLEWLCVHFSMGDKLKLIDAPEDIKQAIVGLSRRMQMLQLHKPYQGKGNAGNAYEIKMVGYPWLATGGETMLARQFVLALLGILEEHGWSIYASIDQKAQGEDSGDLDTWHCVKTKGWTPGMPVFHR
ncbi:hypothetical protein FB45DRAFT_1142854 [Roridomyces roridus]|uniref:Uncharacterized protein n=1 Tax=Roridomyces roridus TaxID=1738132 RepID=A0AAD7FRH7_9AGAR|nr:hypothetical protein FB45DRAFT_1142854 [Roridomyces roridus]